LDRHTYINKWNVKFATWDQLFNFYAVL
jgi:hypothetical protein